MPLKTLVPIGPRAVGERVKRASVIEMSQVLTPSAGQSGYLQEEEIWGENLVHLTSKGYSLVAAGIESLIYEKRSEEKEAEEKGGQGPAKKPRYDAAEHRPAWVKGSVAEAVRRGGGNGGGGGLSRPPYNSTLVGGAATRCAALVEPVSSEAAEAAVRRSIRLTRDPDPATPEGEARAGGGEKGQQGPGAPLVKNRWNTTLLFNLTILLGYSRSFFLCIRNY
jgi:hypothetical protein